MPTFTFASVFTNQLVTLAQFRLNFRSDVNEDTEDFVTDIQIDNMVARGLRDIAFRTKLLPEYADVTLNESASYTIPPTAIYTRQVTKLSADATPIATFLYPLNREQITTNGYGDDRSQFYERVGMNINLFGSSEATGTLRLYATRTPTTPTVDGDFIDLPQQYHELLYLFCEWKYWTRRRVDEEILLSKGDYSSMAKLVKEEVEEQFQVGVTLYGQGT